MLVRHAITNKPRRNKMGRLAIIVAYLVRAGC
jgi:hypothetical protein